MKDAGKYIFQTLIADKDVENIVSTIYADGGKSEKLIPISEYGKTLGGYDIINGIGVMIDIETGQAIELDYETILEMHK